MASKQSGNAIILILIAIFLFGALAAAFTRGMRAGQGSLSANQARLKAVEIADYFSTVDRAIQKLRRRGCAELSIDFTSSADNGYYQAINAAPTAPPDFSCHIFHANGAGLTPSIDPKEYQVSFDAVKASYNPGAMLYETYGNVSFRDGMFGGVVPMFIAQAKPEICNQYNLLMKLDIPVGTPLGNPTLPASPFYKKESFCAYFTAPAPSYQWGIVMRVWRW